MTADRRLAAGPGFALFAVHQNARTLEKEMRIHRFGSTATSLLAQQPAPAQPPASAKPPAAAAPALAPPTPYKQVTIKLPSPVADPSFVAFRKQIGDIAQKKDRAALAKLVAQSFFFVNGEKDSADKKKPGIDNLAKALSLDGKEATGWNTLAEYAREPTAEPDEEHKGVVCAPADPAFDEKAAEALAKATQTDPGDWGYPVKDGVEVHSAGKPDAPVTDKLGLYLVRVYPDDSPAAAVQGPDFIRVVLPSGKTGYVAGDQLLSLGNEQLCYVKEGANWKIAGFIAQ
jgi:hypothetical protein